MEVWNEIWKKILVWNGIWNGRFLVWNGNGMEENFQCGIWKNRLPFHSIPCPAGPTPLGCICDKELFVWVLVFTPECEGKIRTEGGFCDPKRECVP